MCGNVTGASEYLVTIDPSIGAEIRVGYFGKFVSYSLLWATGTSTGIELQRIIIRDGHVGSRMERYHSSAGETRLTLGGLVR